MPPCDCSLGLPSAGTYAAAAGASVCVDCGAGTFPHMPSADGGRQFRLRRLRDTVPPTIKPTRKDLVIADLRDAVTEPHSPLAAQSQPQSQNGLVPGMREIARLAHRARAGGSAWIIPARAFNHGAFG